MDIAEVRAKYPQYADLSDEQLVKGLHSKFYADMPYEQFAAKVGMGQTAAPKPATSLGQQAVAGAYEGLADIAGGPVDLTTMAVNLATKPIRGVVPEINKPLLGSEWWKEKMAGGSPELHAAPQTGTESVVRGGTELATALGVPGIRAKTPAAPLTGTPALAAEMRQTGFAIPPSQAEAGPVARGVEGFAGKIKTAQLASSKNQDVVNALANKALGLPAGTQLSPPTLKAYRESVAEPYRQIAELPTLARDVQQFGVSKVYGPANQDAAGALHDLMQARAESTAYWQEYRRTGVVAARDKAREFDATADGLETLLEKTAMQARRPDLVQALRDARVKIAKSYDIERAMNPATGDIDARAIALTDKKHLLTGELKDIARFAQAFPRASQNLSKIGGYVPDSLVDVGIGTIGAAGAERSGQPWYEGALLGGLRPALRHALLTNYGTLSRLNAATPASANLTPLGVLAAGNTTLADIYNRKQ